MSDTARLVWVSLGGMAVLLLLVIRYKLHALAALVLVSLGIGLAAGMSGTQVVEAIKTGMSRTLGPLALIVGFGAMIGVMLEVSGGAQRIASTITRVLGIQRAPWALGLTGFVVSIPVFFDVGFIVLIPLVFGLAAQTGRPVLYFALPLLAGLGVTHAFVPPTPGPVLVAQHLGADLGLVMLYGVMAGLPCMALAGPLYGWWVSSRVKPMHAHEPPEEETSRLQAHEPPSFALVVGLIVLPLALILGKTASGALLPATHVARITMDIVGEPLVALLLTCLICFHVLGTRRGLSRSQVQDLSSRALEPAGLILLVTGAGGVLKQVLEESGAGKALAGILSEHQAPWPLVAFALALAVRVMQGSATVAMTTAGGLTASLVADVGLNAHQMALLAIAIAAGATGASHVNDSGFWLVNRYLHLSVADTFKTWTVATCIIAATGLGMVMLIWPFVG